MRVIERIAAEERGATAIEYGLIAGLIVLAIIGAIRLTADGTISLWKTVSDETKAVTG